MLCNSFVGDNQEYFIWKFSNESTARFVTCPVTTPHPQRTNTVSRFEEIFLSNILRPTKGGVSVKPGTPRNTPEHPGTPPEHPGTAWNSPEQPRNTPGTSYNTPEHPRNSKEHPGTPKIVVSGQTAHELTKPKTSEDSQFFTRFPSISRMLGIFSKLLRTEKNH